MKISLVIPVLNEEETIEKLLQALADQTKKPDEIIFVDGGSKDKTVKKMENGKWKMEKDNIRFKIFVKPGASIAQGRNYGIERTEREIIVMTDAGCIPHHDWFEKITQPFTDPKIDVVAGFYKMTGESIFQRCLTCYLGILPERLNPKTFLPSARSIAFKKEIWQKVGGFSEKLTKAGEDTLFNYQAKRLGAKFVVVPEALVDWEIDKRFFEVTKKFYIYAKGDGQAGIWWHPSKRFSTHNLKISSIYGRYLVGGTLFITGFFSNFFWILLIVLFLGYLFWAIFKNYKFVKKWQAIFYLPAIQIASDFLVMAGFLAGVLR